MHLKIFLTGFMGSGKTFWGKIWAKENDLEFFDLDEQIEKAGGETIVNIFETKGEVYFRELERDVLKTFAVKNNFILASGGGTPCFFDNLQWMNEQGITIYLEASPGDILQRIIHETQERPLLKGMNQEELLYFIEQKLTEREPFYKQAKYTIMVKGLKRHSLSNILNGNTKY